MVLKIDFDSEEALYTQLCNQIICGIAMDVLHDADDGRDEERPRADRCPGNL